jgi:prepilin-type N-terminal cleavage/methylation domain-containing protein
MRKRILTHLASERAFTLLEMLIVMALIAIVVSISVPMFQAYARNTNFKSGVREISSDFFAMKERAIAENRFYRISFNTTDGTYTLEQGASTGTPYTTVQTKNLTAFGDGIVISSASFGGAASVLFAPRGTCSAGTVVLTNGSKTGTVGTYVTGKTYVRITP